MQAPRIVWTNYKFRLVKCNSNYKLEYKAGYDAMGGDRWEPRADLYADDTEDFVTIPREVFLCLMSIIEGKVNS